MFMYISWKKYCFCCNKMEFRKSIGIHKGTWLENSRYPFDTIVVFVHCWIKNYTTITISFHLNKHDYYSNWKTYQQEVCADLILKILRKFVEWTEWWNSMSCEFINAKTMLVSFIPNSGFSWGICREDNKCFLYALPSHTSDMPLTVICECILTGTTILSDFWKSYAGIQKIHRKN